MDPAIQLHDVVALLDEAPATHYETGQPLRLRRGQIGTVVMAFNGSAFEVEFADRDGRAYALLPIAADKLIVLHGSPSVAVL